MQYWRGTARDPAEVTKKLAESRDAGAITTEFDAKKRELLARM